MGELFAVLGVAASIAVGLFWMFVGWQAMRAHQRLAAAAEEIARAGRPR
ncbi:MAG TPA: hypothetical protein VN914_15815 [Polyangia bacterium]|nr:hypothetical protein [Polyangia bacterium]